MLKKLFLPLIVALAIFAVIGACATLPNSSQLPVRHPLAKDLGESPQHCTRCHERQGGVVPFERYDHGPYWLENHRSASSQGEQVCTLCHQTSFCNDCHATGGELKASIKNQTETKRRMPHRGDYLSRHRIDGRVDPMACFRCHGNPKAAQTCVSCHG